MYRVETLLSLLGHILLAAMVTFGAILAMIAAIITFGVLMALFSGPAAAEANCAPRIEVMEHQANQYGESRRSIGLMESSALVEVFASVETGTWTITITLPDGRTCPIAAGQAFEVFEQNHKLGDPL